MATRQDMLGEPMDMSATTHASSSSSKSISKLKAFLVGAAATQYTASLQVQMKAASRDVDHLTKQLNSRVSKVTSLRTELDSLIHGVEGMSAEERETEIALVKEALINEENQIEALTKRLDEAEYQLSQVKLAFKATDELNDALDLSPEPSEALARTQRSPRRSISQRLKKTSDRMTSRSTSKSRHGEIDSYSGDETAEQDGEGNNQTADELTKTKKVFPFYDRIVAEATAKEKAEKEATLMNQRLEQEKRARAEEGLRLSVEESRRAQRIAMEQREIARQRKEASRAVERVNLTHAGRNADAIFGARDVAAANQRIVQKAKHEAQVRAVKIDGDMAKEAAMRRQVEMKVHDQQMEILEIRRRYGYSVLDNPDLSTVPLETQLQLENLRKTVSALSSGTLSDAEKAALAANIGMSADAGTFKIAPVLVKKGISTMHKAQKEALTHDTYLSTTQQPHLTNTPSLEDTGLDSTQALPSIRKDHNMNTSSLSFLPDIDSALPITTMSLKEAEAARAEFLIRQERRLQAAKAKIHPLVLARSEQKALDAVARQKERLLTEQPSRVVCGRTYEGPAFSCIPSLCNFEDVDAGCTYTLDVQITNISSTFNSFRPMQVPDHLRDYISIGYTPKGRMSAGVSTKITVTCRVPEWSQLTPGLRALASPSSSSSSSSSSSHPHELNFELVFVADSGPFRLPVCVRWKRAAMQITKHSSPENADIQLVYSTTTSNKSGANSKGSKSKPGQRIGLSDVNADVDEGKGYTDSNDTINGNSGDGSSNKEEWNDEKDLFSVNDYDYDKDTENNDDTDNESDNDNVEENMKINNDMIDDEPSSSLERTIISMPNTHNIAKTDVGKNNSDSGSGTSNDGDGGNDGSSTLYLSLPPVVVGETLTRYLSIRNGGALPFGVRIEVQEWGIQQSKVNDKSYNNCHTTKKILNDTSTASSLDNVRDVHNLHNTQSGDRDTSNKPQANPFKVPISLTIPPYSAVPLPLSFHPTLLGLHTAHVTVKAHIIDDGHDVDPANNNNNNNNPSNNDTALVVSTPSSSSLSSGLSRWGTPSSFSILVRVQSSDLPLVLLTPAINFKLCLLDKVYRSFVRIYNASSAAMRVTSTLPAWLADCITFSPETLYVQARSSAPLGVTFKPNAILRAATRRRHALADIAYERATGEQTNQTSQRESRGSESGRKVEGSTKSMNNVGSGNEGIKYAVLGEGGKKKVNLIDLLNRWHEIDTVEIDTALGNPQVTEAMMQERMMAMLMDELGSGDEEDGDEDEDEEEEEDEVNPTGNSNVPKQAGDLTPSTHSTSPPIPIHPYSHSSSSTNQPGTLTSNLSTTTTTSNKKSRRKRASTRIHDPFDEFRACLLLKGDGQTLPLRLHLFATVCDGDLLFIPGDAQTTPSLLHSSQPLTSPTHLSSPRLYRNPSASRLPLTSPSIINPSTSTLFMSQSHHKPTTPHLSFGECSTAATVALALTIVNPAPIVQRLCFEGLGQVSDTLSLSLAASDPSAPATTSSGVVTLLPLSSRLVHVLVSPLLPGRVDRMITIRRRDGKAYKVKITGNAVEPLALFSTSNIQMTPLADGDQVSRVVAITNPTQDTLTLNFVVPSDPSPPSNFSLPPALISLLFPALASTAPSSSSSSSSAMSRLLSASSSSISTMDHIRLQASRIRAYHSFISISPTVITLPPGASATVTVSFTPKIYTGFTDMVAKQTVDMYKQNHQANNQHQARRQHPHQQQQYKQYASSSHSQSVDVASLDSVKERLQEQVASRVSKASHFEFGGKMTVTSLMNEIDDINTILSNTNNNSDNPTSDVLNNCLWSRHSVVRLACFVKRQRKMLVSATGKSEPNTINSSNNNSADSTDSPTECLFLAVTATTTLPAIITTPSTLDFGLATISSPRTVSLTLRNTTSTPLLLTMRPLPPRCPFKVGACPRLLLPYSAASLPVSYVGHDPSPHIAKSHIQESLPLVPAPLLSSASTISSIITGSVGKTDSNTKTSSNGNNSDTNNNTSTSSEKRVVQELVIEAVSQGQTALVLAGYQHNNCHTHPHSPIKPNQVLSSLGSSHSQSLSMIRTRTRLIATPVAPLLTLSTPSSLMYGTPLTASLVGPTSSPSQSPALTSPSTLLSTSLMNTDLSGPSTPLPQPLYQPLCDSYQALVTATALRPSSSLPIPSTSSSSSSSGSRGSTHHAQSSQNQLTAFSFNALNNQSTLQLPLHPSSSILAASYHLSAAGFSSLITALLPPQQQISLSQPKLTLTPFTSATLSASLGARPPTPPLPLPWPTWLSSAVLAASAHSPLIHSPLLFGVLARALASVLPATLLLESKSHRPVKATNLLSNKATGSSSINTGANIHKQTSSTKVTITPPSTSNNTTTSTGKSLVGAESLLAALSLSLPPSLSSSDSLPQPPTVLFLGDVYVGETVAQPIVINNRSPLVPVTISFPDCLLPLSTLQPLFTEACSSLSTDNANSLQSHEVQSLLASPLAILPHFGTTSSSSISQSSLSPSSSLGVSSGSPISPSNITVSPVLVTIPPLASATLWVSLTADASAFTSRDATLSSSPSPTPASPSSSLSASNTLPVVSLLSLAGAHVLVHGRIHRKPLFVIGGDSTTTSTSITTNYSKTKSGNLTTPNSNLLTYKGSSTSSSPTSARDNLLIQRAIKLLSGFSPYACLVDPISTPCLSSPQPPSLVDLLSPSSLSSLATFFTQSSSSSSTSLSQPFPLNDSPQQLITQSSSISALSGNTKFGLSSYPQGQTTLSSTGSSPSSSLPSSSSSSSSLAIISTLLKPHPLSSLRTQASINQLYTTQSDTSLPTLPSYTKAPAASFLDPEALYQGVMTADSLYGSESSLQHSLALAATPLPTDGSVVTDVAASAWMLPGMHRYGQPVNAGSLLQKRSHSLTPQQRQLLTTLADQVRVGDANALSTYVSAPKPSKSNPLAAQQYLSLQATAQMISASIAGLAQPVNPAALVQSTGGASGSSSSSTSSTPSETPYITPAATTVPPPLMVLARSSGLVSSSPVDDCFVTAGLTPLAAPLPPPSPTPSPSPSPSPSGTLSPDPLRHALHVLASSSDPLLLYPTLQLVPLPAMSLSFDARLHSVPSIVSLLIAGLSASDHGPLLRRAARLVTDKANSLYPSSSSSSTSSRQYPKSLICCALATVLAHVFAGLAHLPTVVIHPFAIQPLAGSKKAQLNTTQATSTTTSSSGQLPLSSPSHSSHRSGANQAASPAPSATPSLPTAEALLHTLLPHLPSPSHPHLLLNAMLAFISPLVTSTAGRVSSSIASGITLLIASMQSLDMTSFSPSSTSSSTSSPSLGRVLLRQFVVGASSFSTPSSTNPSYSTSSFTSSQSPSSYYTSSFASSPQSNSSSLPSQSSFTLATKPADPAPFLTSVNRPFGDAQSLHSTSLPPTLPSSTIGTTPSTVTPPGTATTTNPTSSQTITLPGTSVPIMGHRAETSPSIVGIYEIIDPTTGTVFSSSSRRDMLGDAINESGFGSSSMGIPSSSSRGSLPNATSILPSSSSSTTSTTSETVPPQPTTLPLRSMLPELNEQATLLSCFVVEPPLGTLHKGQTTTVSVWFDLDRYIQQVAPLPSDSHLPTTTPSRGSSMVASPSKRSGAGGRNTASSSAVNFISQWVNASLLLRLKPHYPSTATPGTSASSSSSTPLSSSSSSSATANINSTGLASERTQLIKLNLSCFVSV